MSRRSTHNKSIAIAVSVGSCFSLLAGAATAQTVNLQDLIDTLGSFQVANHKISDFQYSSTGDMPPADMVELMPHVDDDGNAGFRIIGGFMDDPMTVGSSTALLEYLVTAIGAGITGAHMQGNPEVNGESGTVNVTETFLPLGIFGEFTGSLFAEGGGADKLTDWVSFNGNHRTVRVQKSISALASQGGSASVGFIDQTFAVPEPGSLLLTVVGLGLLGVWRLHHRKVPQKT